MFMLALWQCFVFRGYFVLQILEMSKMISIWRKKSFSDREHSYHMQLLKLIGSKLLLINSIFPHFVFVIMYIHNHTCFTCIKCNLKLIQVLNLISSKRLLINSIFSHFFFVIHIYFLSVYLSQLISLMYS